MYVIFSVLPLLSGSTFLSKSKPAIFGLALTDPDMESWNL